MRRRKPWWVVAGLAVLIVAGAFALSPRVDPVTEENFGRVQDGMSRAEVEAILGPPGDYTTGPRLVLEPPGPDRACQPDPAHPWTHPDYVGWVTDRHCLWIGFSPAGRVQEKYLEPVGDLSKGALDDLLWRAERQWQRWFPEKD